MQEYLDMACTWVNQMGWPTDPAAEQIEIYRLPGASWQKPPLIFRCVFLVKSLLEKGFGFES